MRKAALHFRLRRESLATFTAALEEEFGAHGSVSFWMDLPVTSRGGNRSRNPSALRRAKSIPIRHDAKSLTLYRDVAR